VGLRWTLLKSISSLFQYPILFRRTVAEIRSLLVGLRPKYNLELTFLGCGGTTYKVAPRGAFGTRQFYDEQ
jgi:hypothetical protein